MHNLVLVVLNGRSVIKATLRTLLPTDCASAQAMYEAFEPKGEFQGLPPRDHETITVWLRALREAGDAEFVIEVRGQIVGHSMLCLANDRTDAEFAIFLHQDYRGLGLGKRLLLGTLNHGCKVLKLDRVWLSVQGSNPRALSLFEKAGFRPRRSAEALQWELEMERRSHCEHCKEGQCILYGQSLPVTITIPRRKPLSA